MYSNEQNTISYHYRTRYSLIHLSLLIPHHNNHRHHHHHHHTTATNHNNSNNTAIITIVPNCANIMMSLIRPRCEVMTNITTPSYASYHHSHIRLLPPLPLPSSPQAASPPLPHPFPSTNMMPHSFSYIKHPHEM